MWCQPPGVTQRKTVRPGRLHQHVSVQSQRRRGPPIPSASAARVPTARRRTPATASRRIRRIPRRLATPPTGVRCRYARMCSAGTDAVGPRRLVAGLTMTTWSTTTQPARCRNRVGLGSGDGPLSVRGCPPPSGHPEIISNRFAEMIRDPPLSGGASAPPPIRNQGSGGSLPGPDAGHPLKGAGRARKRRAGRARCVPDRPVIRGYPAVTSGQSGTHANLGSSSLRHWRPRPPKQ